MLIASRFFVEKVLGVGGMGKVYLAYDSQTGEKVAVKAATVPSRRTRERFLREINALSNIKHKNIVRYIGSGHDETNGIHWYAMEYIPGPTLLGWFAKQDFTFDLFVKIFTRIADALIELERLSIVHRDLKPDNIIINGNEPVLVDFSVAFDAKRNTRLTNEGAMIGTVPYMSPEQVIGYSLDVRSDLYSVGLLMYEILTGFNPLKDCDMSTRIQMILSETFVRPSSVNSKIPGAIEKIVMKLLEKNPEDRFQSACELKFELGRHNSVNDTQDLWKPTPLRDTKIVENPFVGRGTEFEKVMRSFAQTCVGNGQVVQIQGAVGSGKSRMLDEFKIKVLAQGGRFFNCKINGEYSTRPAIAYVLDELADHDLQVDVDSFSKYSNFLRDISPKLAARFGMSAKETKLYSQNDYPDLICDILLSVFSDVCVVYAFDEPEDILTIDVISRLVHRIKESEVMVCIACEYSEYELSDELSNFIRIELNPLSKKDVLAMFKATLGREPLGRELDWVVNYSKGEPKKIIWLLDALKAGADTTTIERLSDDLIEFYKRMLEELPTESRLILDILAVMNKPASYKFLRLVSRLSDVEFEKSVKALESDGLTKEVTRNNEILVKPAIKQLIDAINKSMNKTRVNRISADIALTLEVQNKGILNIDTYRMIAKHYLLAQNYNKAVYFYNILFPYIQSNNQKASEIMGEIEQYMPSITDIKESTILLCNLIELYGQNNQFDKFREYERILMRNLRECKLNNELTFYAYTTLSASSFTDDFYKMGWDTLKKAEQFYDQVEDRKQKIRFLSVKVKHLAQNRLYNEAQNCMNEYFSLVDMDTDFVEYTEGLTLFASVQCYMGQYDTGVLYFDKAIESIKRYGSEREQMQILIRKAGTEVHMGRFGDASDTSRQAMDMASSYEIDREITRLLLIRAYAILYAGEFGEYEKHLIYLNDIIYKTPLNLDTIAWMELLVDHFFLSNQNELAIGLIDHMKNECSKLSKESWYVQILINEIVSLMYRKEYDSIVKHINHIQRFYNSSSESDMNSFQFEMWIKLGLAYIGKREFASARKCVNKATSLMKSQYSDSRNLELLSVEIQLLKTNLYEQNTGSVFKLKYDLSKWKLAMSKISTALSILSNKGFAFGFERVSIVKSAITIIRDRMIMDNDLDTYEKKRIYNFAVELIEGLIGFYRTTGYTYGKERVLRINNALVSLMK